MREPEGVLGRIVAHKREEVARREREVPIAEVRRRVSPGVRGFREALARRGTRFVLEHKRASPSAGALSTGRAPEEIARAYRGVADAVSVLTDARFFGGSFEDLRAVRGAIDVPVLCKDFVVSPYQVTEARSHGADAILIMMSVLSDEEAAACLAEVDALGMEALVEVRDEEELARALGLGARVVGINHRDLRTLQIDLSVSERLSSRVPREVVLVAESGIETRRDVERLAPRVDAFLVGSSLMRAPDVREAARALVLGRVKVCGLTSAEDAAMVAREGALYGGMIFAEESKRRVSEAQAEAIAARAREASVGLPLVGVFVNEAAARVAGLARSLGLAAVQLHGDEDTGYVAQLRALLPDRCEVWKVQQAGAPPSARGARRLGGADAQGAAGGGHRKTTPERLSEAGLGAVCDGVEDTEEVPLDGAAVVVGLADGVGAGVARGVEGVAAVAEAVRAGACGVGLGVRLGLGLGFGLGAGVAAAGAARVGGAAGAAAAEGLVGALLVPAGHAAIRVGLADVPDARVAVGVERDAGETRVVGAVLAGVALGARVGLPWIRGSRVWFVLDLPAGVLAGGCGARAVAGIAEGAAARAGGEPQGSDEEKAKRRGSHETSETGVACPSHDACRDADSGGC
ncbi:MAG: bifunctional indole-3-glycerol-phosphate synthase TrpC/phosphoribosylanthranilate isomerase TrpF [Polyangiaceae bacterium]